MSKMYHLKFNIYEILLWIFFIIFLLTILLLTNELLSKKISLSSTITTINVSVFTEPTTLEVTLSNNTLRSIHKKDNMYITYQFIDSNKKVVQEKKDTSPLSLPLLTRKKHLIHISPPENAGKYILNFFISYDNTVIPIHQTDEIKILCIPTKPNLEKLKITTSSDIFNIYTYENLSIPVTIVNTDTISLMKNWDYYLSYHIYDENMSLIKWDGDRTTLLSNVENANPLSQTLEINDSILKNKGTYYLELDIEEEGVCWFSEKGLVTNKIKIIVN